MQMSADRNKNKHQNDMHFRGVLIYVVSVVLMIDFI